MLTEADVAYIRANFVPLDRLAGERGESLEEVRALVEQEGLPRPSYVLDDGTEMVPADYFALADEAGSVVNLRDAFVARYAREAAAETARLDPAEDEWSARSPRTTIALASGRRPRATGSSRPCARPIRPSLPCRRAW